MNILLLLLALLLPERPTIDPLPIEDVPTDVTTDVTLTSDKIWRLKGFTTVRNGATLTIEPGTVVLGDSETQGTLIITRGSKIMAEGTPMQPIVFTSDQPPGSREPGDWGGVVLLGRAPINTETGEFNVEGIPPSPVTLAGGSDPDDDSGVMRYVRIEFAGEELTPNNELNGLTMAGVGRGTIIEFIQVSYNDDDAFEWFGGTVDARYLVSFAAVDDDFDGDLGWQGRVQFGLILRDPDLADAASGGHSNAFEQDNAPNEATGAGTEPRSSPVFSNVTVIGPIGHGLPIHDHNQNGMRLRTGTQIGIFNSIVSGFPGLIRIDGPSSWNFAQNDLLHVQNVIGTGAFTNSSSGASSTEAEQWFLTSAFGNQHLPSVDDVGLANPFYYADGVGPMHFDPRPTETSPAASGARFDHPRLDDFFAETDYVGAFAPGGDRWDLSWANYDPRNTDYSAGVPVRTGSFDELPRFVALHSNYPNPFNPMTTISFTLDRAQHVRLAVYDLLGRQVALLMEGIGRPGLTSVRFQAEGIPSGTYLYRIDTESGSRVRTLTLIK